MTVRLTGDETAADLERIAHAAAIDIPTGYTRIGVLTTSTGTYLLITGEDVPAMGLVPGKEPGSSEWTRAFNGGAVQ